MKLTPGRILIEAGKLSVVALAAAGAWAWALSKARGNWDIVKMFLFHKGD